MFIKPVVVQQGIRGFALIMRQNKNMVQMVCMDAEILKATRNTNDEKN